MVHKTYLSNNIRVLRKSASMPQEELADKLFVTHQVISKWEKGKSDPPIESLITIAEYFNVSLDELILRAIQPKNPLAVRLETNIKEENVMKSNITISENPHISINSDTNEHLFPRVSPENVTAYNKFTQAYNLDIQSSDTDDAEKQVRAMHLYLEAFDEGVKEAAVNMLRVLTKILFNMRDEVREAELPFQDRIKYFLEGLEEIDSQEGRYYHALLLLYGLISTGESQEDNVDLGFQMMNDLEEEGHEYAKRFIREKIKRDKK